MFNEDRDAGILRAGKYFVVSILSLFFALVLYAVVPPAVHAANPGNIVTIAGGGSGGLGDGGLATSATLNNPFDVSIDTAGNIYIADTYNNRIRKVDHNSGIITTVAGNGIAGYSGDSGPATSANLNHPTGVSVDVSGNIYIADYGNNRIREVYSSGTITTVAGTGTPGYSGDGGPATSAKLFRPYGVSVDASGNLYIVDQYNSCIREVYSSGTITTVAGTGTAGYSGDDVSATSSRLDFPDAVSVDTSKNIYIADTNNQRIRKVLYSSGTITTVAGNGTIGYSGDGGLATSATFSYPTGVWVDASRNIYIADYGNNRIREVYSSGTITTVAGTGTAGYSGDDGPATSAELNSPSAVLVDASGNVYIVDYNNNRIRKVLAHAPSINVTDSIAPISDLQMNFGSIIQGTSSSTTLTISNTGNADLTVTNIQITGTDPGQFSLDQYGGASPCNSTAPSLAAGSNCTMTIMFSPTSLGPKSATLTIVSNDLSAATVSVSLSGTGMAIPAPQIDVTNSINFGNVTQGLISEQTVTVTNKGIAGLTITTISQPTAPFSIITNCSSTTIAPSSTCTLTVRFAPTALGTFSDSIDISSNDPTTPTVILSVSGTANNAPPTVPILVYPTDGQTGLGTTINFQWKKSSDPDGNPVSYHLYVSSDPNFVGCTPINVASSQTNRLYFAGLGMYGGLMMIGMVFAGTRKGRKGLVLLIVVVFLASGAILVSCGGGGGGGGGGGPTNEVSTTVSNLSSGKTYYWKVVADDHNGGTAESAAWSFSTQ